LDSIGVGRVRGWGTLLLGGWRVVGCGSDDAACDL
jgi:hypothetical protein